jgi:glycerol-3-phosphate dehydrogenase
LGELDAEFAAPVSPGTEITAAEIVWAIRNEGALDVADVLERRTRLSLIPADAEAAAPRVAELVDKSLAGLA